jgi:hypothetical protein
MNTKIDIYIDEFNVSKFKSEFNKLYDTLSRMSAEKVEKLLKKHWRVFKAHFKERKLDKDAINIINKQLGTNFKSLDDVPIDAIAMMKSESVMNEDFKHFWDFTKEQLFPTLSFYPALTVWMQLDKLLTGSSDFNLRLTIIYAIFWLLLMSGKFVKEWKKWKKENPEEFAKEGGKKNPFAIR